MLDRKTSSDSCGDGQTSALAGKEEKDRERRRKRYKFALVRWKEMGGWEDYPKLAIEYKDVLNQWYMIDYEVICDDQPERVLRGMLKLLKEDKDG